MIIAASFLPCLSSQCGNWGLKPMLARHQMGLLLWSSRAGFAVGSRELMGSRKAQATISNVFPGKKWPKILGSPDELIPTCLSFSTQAWRSLSNLLISSDKHRLNAHTGVVASTSLQCINYHHLQYQLVTIKGLVITWALCVATLEAAGKWNGLNTQVGRIDSITLK